MGERGWLAEGMGKAGGWEGGQAGAGVQTELTDLARRSQDKGCEGLL